MDLRKTVIEILEGSPDYRIDEVTKLLKNGGVVTADDLKYFDWNSLKELGNLSTMEVNKIMRYIQENFLHEYGEHKRKRNEERKLQNETEILKFKAEHEKKLQQEKIKFEEEKATRMKEQQEKKEEFRRSLQNQQNQSKKSNTFFQGGITKLTKACANVMEKFNSKCESKKGNVMTIKEVISEILKGFDETRIAEVVSLLSGIGATTADDLQKYNRSTLDCIDGLTDEERNKIMTFIGRNLKEEIAKILNISNPARVEEISSVLQEDGLKVVDELRFYDWTSLEILGKLSNAEISKIVEFVKEQFPESYEKHKRRRENEIKMMEELKQLKTDERMNFEEVISKLFTGYSTETRINKIKEILHEDGVKRAGELRYFDWKLLGYLELTNSETTRIMEFVKQNFPKHFKIHEIRRDEANRMQEELSKCKEEITKLSKSAKQSREKKTEDVEMQEKQSSFQAEATEQRQQKMDEASSNKSEDQTQTKNSIHLQEEPQKSSSHSGTVMLKRGIKTENYQTQEDCSNHQAGNPPNDSFKDSNSNNNTSNDQPQESEDN